MFVFFEFSLLCFVRARTSKERRTPLGKQLPHAVLERGHSRRRAGGEHVPWRFRTGKEQKNKGNGEQRRARRANEADDSSSTTAKKKTSMLFFPTSSSKPKKPAGVLRCFIASTQRTPSPRTPSFNAYQQFHELLSPLAAREPRLAGEDKAGER